MCGAFFSSLLVVTESSQRAGIAYRAIVCEVEMAGVAATATQHTDKMGNGNAEVTNRNTKRQTGTIQNISQHIRVMEKKKNTPTDSYLNFMRQSACRRFEIGLMCLRL